MIYYILARDFNRVKIGYTKSKDSLTSRFNALQTGCPCKLDIIMTHYGDTTVEASLHKAFERYRVYGEWFDYHPVIARYILASQSIHECSSEHLMFDLLVDGARLVLDEIGFLSSDMFMYNLDSNKFLSSIRFHEVFVFAVRNCFLPDPMKDVIHYLENVSHETSCSNIICRLIDPESPEGYRENGFTRIYGDISKARSFYSPHGKLAIYTKGAERIARHRSAGIGVLYEHLKSMNVWPEYEDSTPSNVVQMRVEAV